MIKSINNVLVKNVLQIILIGAMEILASTHENSDSPGLPIFNSLSQTAMSPVSMIMNGVNPGVRGALSLDKSLLSPTQGIAQTAKDVIAATSSVASSAAQSIPDQVHSPEFHEDLSKLYQNLSRDPPLFRNSFTDSTSNVPKVVQSLGDAVFKSVEALSKDQALNIGYGPGSGRHRLNIQSGLFNYGQSSSFEDECQFRIACELGKTLRPLGSGVGQVVEDNRFLRDMQNKYSEAMTYGLANHDCNRYFCAVISLFGGLG